MRRLRNDRGAVAVEFALILPILLGMLLAIAEFGLAYNAQISVTSAAREAARSAALGKPAGEVLAAARLASPSLDPQLAAANLAITPATCTTGATMRITITYTHDYLTGFFAENVALTGKAAMRCGG